MRGHSFLSLFETYPFLAWSIVASLGLAIFLHAAHKALLRRKADRVQAARDYATRDPHRAAWELVDQKAHEKTKRQPGYARNAQEDAAECAHLIGIPFDVDGFGLEWAAHHQSRDVMDTQARMIAALGGDDLAQIIRKGAIYCDIFSHPDTPGDTEDPRYKALAAQCKEIEEQFNAAGGIERYRQIVDDYLDAHYPWSRPA